MPRPNDFSIMVARFPGGSLFPVDMPDTTDYFAKIMYELKNRTDCEKVLHVRVSDTPITMSRNLVVESAKHEKVDFLLMLDNDMNPDMYVGSDPGAQEFLPTALQFILDRWDTGPHLVGAPYCGKPPFENVFVFQWSNWESNSPNPDYRLEQFTREEAARKIGIERVAALPTGLVLFDMRVFNQLAPPYFYYEFRDETESVKGSTEDVTLTRDAGLAGCKVWCLWSSWAGHYKLKCVGKPTLLYTEQVGAQMRQAVLNNFKESERVLECGDKGGHYIPPHLAKETVDAKV